MRAPCVASIVGSRWRPVAPALFAIGLLVGCGHEAGGPSSSERPLPLIPQPAKVVRGEGAFRLTNETKITFDEPAAQVAQRLTDVLSKSGWKLTSAADGEGAAGETGIVLKLTAAESADNGEGYSLTVSPQRIVISAPTPRGLFYGGVTLWQLATGYPKAGDGSVEVPAVEIQDAPRFRWRGALIDVARHFVPPESMKAMIDWMALHKLNTLHWHLTDDQGWRLEIKKYPRLTEVGAWRIPAGAAGRDPATGQPRRYGGFYTQEEVRDIVRYAADRYITIVPEIEMPGHAQAAIAAYPQLGTGETPPVSHDWGIHTYLFNVEDETFAFLEDVLGEVITLFPGKYIHVGGDEAAKDRWQASKRVHERMQALGVADEEKLQGYFTKRIEKFLDQHGRSLVGWDEILEGGIAPNATVMSWRGVQGAIEAASAGHDVIMASDPDVYFDHLQSETDGAPGRLGVISLRHVYQWEPVPADMPAAASSHVLGAQGNLWSEHMRTPQRVEHAAFPRLAAIAEITWSPRESRDWPSFVRRLGPQFARYTEEGIHFADEAVAPGMQADYSADARNAKVTLSNQMATGKIRYTLDGSAPSAQSRLYESPLELALPADLRAATFIEQTPAGSARRWHLDARARLTRTDEELRTCSNKLVLHLEDDAPFEGERAVFLVDIMDACWIYPQAPLEGVKAVEVTVGQLPYNFQLWKDTAQIVTRPITGDEPALEVHAGDCNGETIARLPIAPATKRDELTTLRAPLSPRPGAQDLCLAFASGGHDPLWVIDRVELLTDVAGPRE